MSVSLLCASHSPLMYCYKQAPDSHSDVVAAYEERARAIAEFDPELVIVFGTDHFNGFFVNMMPSFCIGTACKSVGDIGGHESTLNVPADIAVACVDYLRSQDIDVACSHAMRIDHGFSQVMFRCLGAMDRYPVIPIFINAINHPFVPFRRSRLLGEALSSFIEQTGKRVLVIGSGGLSHHPAPIYPPYGTSDEAGVTHYQLNGGTEDSEGLTHDAWLDRLVGIHHMAADWVVDGTFTAEMLRLNPEFDREFLDLLRAGKLEVFDHWDPGWVIEQAGIGAMEVHTWVAAVAATRRLLEMPLVQDVYEPSIEYGIGVGMIHA